MSDDRVSGPTSARCVEFSGYSWGEAFRVAADWFAANDGEVSTIRAIGPAILPATGPQWPHTWYVLNVYYDD
ncbi:hypothetical protein [Nocardia cyriacigeorgica]|uniref:hypothetical protein n=1 Tax=Nocardia cyriacigeorgica TaxID=135487 RepID=UPI002458F604|nr:hypothetical protein [Nocardia cyriacigeorgica]